MDTEPLWQPLSIGPVSVKHRIMATAHSLAFADNHILSDRHIEYYRERAKGGTALLITEQHAAHPQSLGSFYHCLTAWDERAVPQFAKLADAVHEHGAKQFVQLMMTGVQDKGSMMTDWHTLWGASRIPSYLHNEVPQVMGRNEITSVIRGYAQSARNVFNGGLDGVEIHGAHSYLIAQFLSPFYNRRTDSYGGSPSRRCKLAIEVAEAVRAATKGAIAVGIRLSYDEFMGQRGITPDDCDEQIDLLASSELFDFFDISAGSYNTLHFAVPTMEVEDAWLLPYGQRAKRIVGDRGKVFLVGRIRDGRDALRVLLEHAADMVAMTRAQIADPFLVTKLRAGRDSEVIRCIGANECLLRNFKQLDVACIMNPVTGREAKWGDGSVRRVTQKMARRIVVVGGGPAGMKCAALASERGHAVTLFEAEKDLGGHLNLLKRLPRRRGWAEAVDTLSGQVQRAGVVVRTNVVATPDLVLAENPDIVVCATGSTWDRTGFSAFRWDRDRLPGADQKNVLDIAEATIKAFDNPKSLGRRILILDETGEYLPLGLADMLSDAGVQIEIVTRKASVGEEVLAAYDAPFVMPRLARAGVRLTPQSFVEMIDGTRVEIYGIWGGEHRIVHADTIVLAMYRSPRDSFEREIRGRVRHLSVIGDALAPRRTTDVIYEGEKVGREL